MYNDFLKSYSWMQRKDSHSQTLNQTLTPWISNSRLLKIKSSLKRYNDPHYIDSGHVINLPSYLHNQRVTCEVIIIWGKITFLFKPRINQFVIIAFYKLFIRMLWLLSDGCLLLILEIFLLLYVVWESGVCFRRLFPVWLDINTWIILVRKYNDLGNPKGEDLKQWCWEPETEYLL